MLVVRSLTVLLFVLGLASACSNEKSESGNNAVVDVASEAGDAVTQKIPLGKLPDDATPSHYRLHLNIDPDIETFSGSVLIDVTLHKELDGIWMHGNGITTQKVWLQLADGKRLDLPADSFSQKEPYGTARLDFGQQIPAGEIKLGFEYTAPYSTDLLGLHIVTVDGVRYATTQFEMIAARRVFPGFDEPKFKTTYDLSITTKEAYVAVTNTPEIESTLKDGWRTTSYAPTPVLPTYLLAFVVGPWEIVTWGDIPATELRPEPLPLRGIATKGNGKKLENALAGSADIVLELERYFGVPYPFRKLDIVAVPDFAYGAMENAGLITYRDNLLFIDDDSPASQKKAYIGVHAHELAHQWFGNRVTMPWWNDIWLNESFATWAGTRAANAVHPDYKFNSGLQSSSIAVMGNDSLASVRRIAEAVNNSDDILNAFDGITYQKGGAVLRMFESFVGPEKFRAAIHYHLQRFPYGTATALDFFESVEESTKMQGVKAAFASFIDQRGVPLVNVALTCDDNGAKLQVSQERYLPLGSSADSEQSWNLPFCYAMQVDDQRLRNCELLDKAESSIALASCPDWVMPNGNGMGYYRWSMDANSLSKLSAAFDQLTEGEQQSFADSLGASLSAGQTDFASYMAAVPAMVTSGNRPVVTAPINLWSWLHRNLGDTAKQASAALIIGTYSELLSELNSKESLNPEQQSLQTSLTGFLAGPGNDQELRASLAQEAVAFLKAGDTLETVQWDNMRVALTVAIEDVNSQDSGFGSVVKRIQELFHQTRRSVVRNAMLAAIGSATTQESIDASRVLIFDASLKSNEIPTLLAAMNGASHAGESWQWFTQNFAQLVPRMPQNRQQQFPTYASQFCSAEGAEEAADFFVTRIDSLLGARRMLTQTLEGINLCAAKKAQHLASAERYFIATRP